MSHQSSFIFQINLLKRGAGRRSDFAEVSASRSDEISISFVAGLKLFVIHTGDKPEGKRRFLGARPAGVSRRGAARLSD